MFMSIDPQDKKSWIKTGEKYEKLFFDLSEKHYGIKTKLNPEKLEDKTRPDLLVNIDNKWVYGDLKSVRTPLFSAKKFSKYYNLDPSFSVTFNHIDYIKYLSEFWYEPFKVFFWVNWPKQTNYGVTVQAQQGLWVADIHIIDDLICNSKTGFIVYKNRTNSRENAKSSHIISLNDIHKIEELESDI